MVAATIERHQPDSYQLTVDEALNVLGGDAQCGLSESEARARVWQKRNSNGRTCACMEKVLRAGSERVSHPVADRHGDLGGALVVGLITNRWLWLAIILSLALQAAVVYLPLLQQAFSTVGLSLTDWLGCAAVASSVLWLRELSKSITRGLKA